MGTKRRDRRHQALTGRPLTRELIREAVELSSSRRYLEPPPEYHLPGCDALLGEERCTCCEPDVLRAFAKQMEKRQPQS